MSIVVLIIGSGFSGAVSVGAIAWLWKPIKKLIGKVCKKNEKQLNNNSSVSGDISLNNSDGNIINSKVGRV